MLRHLLLLALRGLWRYRMTTAINLVALALGLLCFVLATAFSTAIDKADSRWPNAERIAVITEQALSPGNGRAKMDATRVAPMTARYIKADFPELEAVSSLRFTGNSIAKAGDRTAPAESYAADEDFPHIFAWPLRSGEWRTAFSRPDGAVLSQDVARTLFGDAEPLGKSITIADHELVVTGVIGTFPNQVTAFSNWRLILVASQAGDALLKERNYPDIWANRMAECFVLLRPGASIADLDRRLADFALHHVPEDQGKFAFGAMGLAGLTDALFHGIAGLPLDTLFLVLGCLVLGIAILNYMNLAAGLAHGRLREMAVRRLLGETSRSIAVQILLECALLALVALVLTFGLVAVAPPLLDADKFNGAGLDFPLSLPLFWLRLGLGLTAAIFAGGLYPALILARSRPSEIAQGAHGGNHSRLLPSLLVGAQFLLGSLLLIAVLVVAGQSTYLTRVIEPEGGDLLVVTLNMPHGMKLSAVRAETRAIPAIHTVSAAGVPLFNNLDVKPYRRADDPAASAVQASGNWVNDGFFDAIGASFVAGRDFAGGAGDAGSTEIVIDRSFARALGWTPQEAVGQEIAAIDPKRLMTMRVIGVIEDHPTAAYGRGARGALYQAAADMMPNGILRIAEPDSGATLEAIDKLFRRLAPDQHIVINRLSDTLRWNDQSALFLKWLQGLAAFAFAIGIVGLAGMALHVTARRRHEVGIRKVLGAGPLSVMLLLMRDFSRPVLLANLLAWPVAYIGERAYLDLFTRRPAFSPLPFLIALAASLGVAALAVGWQAWRAARRDPAAVLRYE